MTGRRLAVAFLAALLAAATWAGTSSSSAPIMRVALIVVNGKGKVTSVPKGISCPPKCRGQFPKDGLVHLAAHPAPGWRVVSYAGYCRSKSSKCSFNLTTSHDCSSKVCAVGAFGVQVFFVKQT